MGFSTPITSGLGSFSSFAAAFIPLSGSCASGHDVCECEFLTGIHFYMEYIMATASKFHVRSCLLPTTVRYDGVVIVISSSSSSNREPPSHRHEWAGNGQREVRGRGGGGGGSG